MARGWESKSVADQQAEANLATAPRRRKSSAQLTREAEEQRLQLSCKYLRQQLCDAKDPRHRKMIEAALADLEAKLKPLGCMVSPP